MSNWQPLASGSTFTIVRGTLYRTKDGLTQYSMIYTRAQCPRCDWCSEPFLNDDDTVVKVGWNHLRYCTGTADV